MKILWLSHLVPYPPKGGVLQRSYNLIRELSKYHELDLLAFNQNNMMRSIFQSIEQGIDDSYKVLSSICREVQFFEIPNDKNKFTRYRTAFISLFNDPFNINWLKSKDYAAILSQYLDRKKYDLVHFDTISLVPYLMYIPTNTPTCLDHHNIESHMLLRRSKNENNYLKKIYFLQESIRLKKYEKKNCPMFSLNITCSDVDTERLSFITPTSNILTIPNGVDLEYFKNENHKNKNKNKSIIFVGSMNWYPNKAAVIYIAENLWPLLKNKYENLQFDIVGSNPPDKILSLSKKYKDIHVHGFVDDVRPYIEAASVYICPIQDGGGTKLKILDAMALESAIVAHPIACEGINVTDGLNIFLAHDQTSFVDKVSCLLDNTEIANSVGLEARRLIQSTYGFDAIGKQLANAFEQCRSDL